jgi:hypothetical protein
MKSYMSTINTWSDIRKFYKKVFGVDGKTVDLLSSFDILRLYAQGLGYNSIARILDCDIPYIKYSVKYYYKVEAREHDLDISPIMCYNSGGEQILSPTDLTICEIYKELEKKIETYEQT